MKKMTRRQALVGIAGVAVAAPVAAQIKTKPSKKKLPCGLKELPLPVVEFDEKGEIANALELFGDMPYTKEIPSAGFSSTYEHYTRSRKVYVKKEHAVSVTSKIGLWFGEMELEEVVSHYICWNHAGAICQVTRVSFALDKAETSQETIEYKSDTQFFNNKTTEAILANARKRFKTAK